ncbi:hypothetical protein BEWA_035730 [Theileria equi strain WA]|uniref:Uncharacterized protein n=1 Tax=Theileria equi strain WA TaxID=1537102 RepID=L1LDL0_THEEQ|nr:hypothetical protein BEWA_035730 [Theileria equi strain WA]EKX73537.1 hypothetical protein BEWA_035730 [Theileria equi strain WA]|eukprot:XP_004832989.1 hypothetical protein BEWA_035730 [Theileria equi strain WA]
MSADAYTLKLSIERKCVGNDCGCQWNPKKPDGLETEKNEKVDQVVGFVSYTHFSKEEFKLLKSLGNNEKLDVGGNQEVKHVKKASVYYCDKDYEGINVKPLLIEVKDNGNRSTYYLKYEDGELEEHDSKVWKKRGGSLQDLLNERNLGVNNRIPLHLDQPDKHFESDSNISKEVTVQSVGDKTTLSGSEYTAKTYKITDQNVRLSRVENDKEKIDIKIPHDTLDGIKLYYSPVNPNVPLMFELKSSNGGDSTFYESISQDGNNWIEVGKGKSKNFYTDKSGTIPQPALAEQLDKVLCSQGYVTIDLSYDTSTSGGRYCCEDHGGKGKNDGRVTVSEVSGPSRSSSITFYGHSITSPGLSLAGIYYKDTQGKRNRIKIPGLDNSGDSSVKLYTFYSNGSKDPKLIFVEYTDQPNFKGWYRGSTTDGSQWKKVLNAPKKSPDEVKGKGSSEGEFKKYVDKLNCIISGTGGECADTSKLSSLPPPAGPQGLPEPEEPTLSLYEALEKFPAPPPEPEALGDPVSGGILTVLTGLGSTSGTLVGSAATFFGGWKPYNCFKGDTWIIGPDYWMNSL